MRQVFPLHLLDQLGTTRGAAPKADASRSRRTCATEAPSSIASAFERFTMLLHPERGEVDRALTD